MHTVWIVYDAQVAIGNSVPELRPIEWTLAERIRKVRTLFDMEQPEFGALFGVTEKAISTWETGRNQPRHLVKFAQEVERLAAERGYDVPWSWLLTPTAHNPRYVNVCGVTTEMELLDPNVRFDRVSEAHSLALVNA